MTTSQAPVAYSYFHGNVDFYNDPKYREANKKFYECIELLKELGMEHNQACDWIHYWGYEDEGCA